MYISIYFFEVLDKSGKKKNYAAFNWCTRVGTRLSFVLQATNSMHMRVLHSCVNQWGKEALLITTL